MACTRSWGESAGPLTIDYQYIVDCTLGSQPAAKGLFVLALVAWVVALIHLLGHTAGNYLSPTLGKICERLHLTYNVAGVTFLAFGNGAPDVFSSITSFLGGEDAPLIGINALLGGSMFVCTVVVGSIAILCPCELSGKVFLRDILFHVVAVTAVACIAAQQTTTLSTAAILFFLYFLYVTTVLSSAWIDELRSQQRTSSASRAVVSTTTIAGSKPIPDGALGSSLQTAFWHHSPRPKPESALPSKGGGGKPSGHSSPPPAAAGGAYTFLILDEHGEGDDSLDADDATITLSGGLISPAFSGTIIEDYCSRLLGSDGAADHKAASRAHQALPAPWQSMRTGRGGGGAVGGGGLLGSLMQHLAPSASPLRDRLLPQDGAGDLEGEGDADARGEGETVEMGVLDGGRAGGAHGSFGRFSSGPEAALQSAGRAGGSKPDALLTGLYWQQWMLQRRIRKSLLSSELWSDAPLSRKVVLLLEAPFTLLRDVSIPTLQPESWSKPLAVLHPIACPLVVLLAVGKWDDQVGAMPLPLLSCLVGLVPAAAILLLTHHSRPPSSRTAASLWVLSAFFMCVTWIYLLAGELVCCLESLGRILAVPSAYLGLTVLAWGNSIGDFFSNTSLARRGLGEMAVAGCYGGPVFNILVGLALSIGYACLQLYPAPFVIRLDTSSVVSLVFLYVALGCTSVVVSLRGFRLERGTGYLLVGLYVVYSVVQAGVVLGQAGQG